MEINKLQNNPKYIGAMNLSVLEKLPRVEEGEIAFCNDTSKVMIYKDGKWVEFSDNSGLKLNLYDLNKSIISQLKDLNEEQLYAAMKTITVFAEGTNNKYHMLYGKEISYFTLFVKDFYAKESLGKEVINCLKNIGKIKSIELTENKDAIEIWICDSENELTVLYLFPYDNGVIEVK